MRESIKRPVQKNVLSKNFIIENTSKSITVNNEQQKFFAIWYREQRWQPHTFVLLDDEYENIVQLEQ